LSVEYDKNKWLYGILGVVAYYLIGGLFVFIVAFLDIYLFEWGFDWESRFGVNYLSLPTGLLGVWCLYIILEKKWKKSVLAIKDEINDIGEIID
jgi:hypothetical protein